MADEFGGNNMTGGVEFAPTEKPVRRVVQKSKEEINPFVEWRKQQEQPTGRPQIDTTKASTPTPAPLSSGSSSYTEWRRQQEAPAAPASEAPYRYLPPIDIGRRSPITEKAADVARAAGTQGVLGLTADVPGAIGDISRLYESVSQFPYKAALKGAEYLGLMPKGKTAAQFEEEAKRLFPVSEAEEKGLVSSVYGLPFPTSAGMEKIETSLVPALEYKGISPEAQATGRLTRFGTSMIPGGGGLSGAFGRFSAGAAGSTLGQLGGVGIEELRKSGVTGLEPYTPYIEPALTMLGTTGAVGLGRAFGAGAQRKAAEELSDLMKKDISSGRVSAEEFNLAKQGRLPMADLFGPGTLTRSYLERQAGMSSEDIARSVEGYSLTTGKDVHGAPIREPQSQQATQSFLAQVHGAPISAPALTATAKQTGAQIRQNVYNVAKQAPAAQAIDASVFGTEIGRQTPLVDNPLMQGAIKEAIKTSKSAPASWGIQAPVIDKKTGQTIAAGNLPFWDQVKRELDNQITHAMPSGAGPGNPTLVSSLEPIRTQLVGTLDKIVPQYASAREAALDTFRSASAPEAGMDFYKRMNAFNTNDAIRAFSQMSPQGQQLFKSGFMHALHDEVGTAGGISKIANKLIRDVGFQEKAKLALGSDYDAIRGRLMIEDISNKARAINPKQIKPGYLEKYGTTGVGAALALAADLAVQSQFLAPTHAAAFIGGGALTAAQQMAQRSYLKKIADNAVTMMLSKDPADHARLSKMMSENPAFANTIGEINSFIQSASQPRKEREGRATGGRIGMTAERLLSMLEGAKKSVQQDTEALLQEPDEKIAKALTIAKEGI